MHIIIFKNHLDLVYPKALNILSRTPVALNTKKTLTNIMMVKVQSLPPLDEQGLPPKHKHLSLDVNTNTIQIGISDIICNKNDMKL